MSFPVPNEYDMPDVKYDNGDVVTYPPSLSGDGTGFNLSQLEKNLILDLFSKASYLEDADASYTALENLWTPTTKELESITAVYTQTGTVYDNESLDSLKSDLVVTANYSDGTSEVVTAYTLSGTLTEGTSTITVSYGEKTTSFDVTVTHYTVSLDTIVYEGKSYRDIFMTANQLQGFDFESGLPSGMTVNSGSPSISTDDCYSTSHSLKAFGSTSTQYKSLNTNDVADWNKYANTSYFVAYKAKCTRYAAGSLGVSISNGITPNGVTGITDGWITVHKYTTTTNGISINTAYIGSYSSADLDGYVDDIVIIPMTNIFTNIPTEAQMLQWYNEYCDIRKAGGV